jgi:hypothetical protein
MWAKPQRFARLPKIFQILSTVDWTQNDNQLRFTRRTQGAEDANNEKQGAEQWQRSKALSKPLATIATKTA